ncbi:hypothetical protein [Fodinicurvata fenggangensis]|uniref:hypothetical protein n=1 Tax=Fodinicurvata fenggangensis TaxID=1121830 RepID=UPI000479BBC0|nr:hypothetical protein [Fodinicurvata fenggangensis]
MQQRDQMRQRDDKPRAPRSGGLGPNQMAWCRKRLGRGFTDGARAATQAQRDYEDSRLRLKPNGGQQAPQAAGGPTAVAATPER